MSHLRLVDVTPNRRRADRRSDRSPIKRLPSDWLGLLPLVGRRAP